MAAATSRVCLRKLSGGFSNRMLWTCANALKRDLARFCDGCDVPGGARWLAASRLPSSTETICWAEIFPPGKPDKFRAPENVRAAGPPARTRNCFSPHWSCQSHQHHSGRQPCRPYTHAPPKAISNHHMQGETCLLLTLQAVTIGKRGTIERRRGWRRDRRRRRGGRPGRLGGRPGRLGGRPGRLGGRPG